MPSSDLAGSEDASRGTGAGAEQIGDAICGFSTASLATAGMAIRVGMVDLMRPFSEKNEMDKNI